MALDCQRRLDPYINELIYDLAPRTTRLINNKLPRQITINFNGADILSKLYPKCAISDLLKLAIFIVFMSTSSMATAYGISIPDDPINDSVIVRLQTTSIPSQYSVYPDDTDITNWWVQAGSTGTGAGQSDYFSSGALEAPRRINAFGPATLPPEGVQVGTSNALVTNLPMNGERVFLSIWLKRQDQPWKLVSGSFITSASSITPTATVERNRYSYHQYFFGSFVWGSASMAPWYQIWINDEDDNNVHNEWYSHKDVCLNTPSYIAKDCATYISPLQPYGTVWVRAWSIHGGYGPWSQPATVNFETNKIEG